MRLPVQRAGGCAGNGMGAGAIAQYNCGVIAIYTAAGVPSNGSLKMQNANSAFGWPRREMARVLSGSRTNKLYHNTSANMRGRMAVSPKSETEVGNTQSIAHDLQLQTLLTAQPTNNALSTFDASRTISYLITKNTGTLTAEYATD